MPAMNFVVRHDWVEAEHSTDVVMQCTMARVAIEMNGRPVTAVRDLRNRRYRTTIIVPLFVIADWVVSNWWHLFHEPADTKNQKEQFEERHNLAYAGDGFLLPMLNIAPSSERIHVQVERWRPKHGAIEFLEDIDTYIEPQELRSELAKMVETVIRRLGNLDKQFEDARRLADTWHAINSLDAGEREFSSAAAMHGIDPFDVDDRVAGEIVAFWQRVEPSIREDALATASPDSLSVLRDWLGQAVEELSSSNSLGSDNFWLRVRERIRKGLSGVHPLHPWRQGYELARSVRSELGVGDDEPFDFESEGERALHCMERTAPVSRFDGLVADTHPACITARRGYETSRRFLRARALGDYMSRTGQKFGILNSLNTDRQALTRAFAAELLAPADSLPPRSEAPGADDEDIEKLSRKFKVSPMVISHQIRNRESRLGSAWAH